MRLRVGSGQWIAVSRIALVGLIGSTAAACSTDTMRFAENPFSNPFASSERVASSQPAPSVPAQQPYASAAMPTSTVQAQALPPVQSAPLSQPTRMAAAPVAYNPPLTRSAPPVQTAAMQPAAQPKFRLVDNSKAAARPVEPVETPKRSRPGMMATAQAQPLPAKFERTPTKAEPARVVTASAEPLVPEAKPVIEPKAAPAPKVAALVEPQATKPVAMQPVAPAPAPVAQPEAARASTPEPEQTASISGDFRWPARGRVIAGFGANGGNEGINIAVPEGTPVKAAEAGTVTYAGSEVKGYGNLVLIRHENGYVSAYAHNGSLNVKRGEQVKRGQVIATSGQTGNVTSPQLHFEIRKGSTPVDPVKYLGG
jgi:murein DD-endopeptidase MepM/ murein hydrolase activator NlpD